MTLTAKEAHAIASNAKAKIEFERQLSEKVDEVLKSCCKQIRHSAEHGEFVKTFFHNYLHDSILDNDVNISLIVSRVAVSLRDLGYTVCENVSNISVGW